MIGEIRFVISPRRGSSNEWQNVVYRVQVLEEIPLGTGNQRLFRVSYDDGTTGTAWENQLKESA